jgi:putative ABC transport system ATP-binding protein
MLELRYVTQQFRNNQKETITALKDVSLRVQEGEFVSIVGPSGSGKSTLLFIMGALLRPTKGEVYFMGEDIYSHPASYRATLRLERIGFVFQTFNLIPYLNALDNVALPAVLTTGSRRRATEKAEELLRRFGLGHRLNHKVSELSVGERQRVAVCRSVINEPALLLADEPTGNLDPEMTHEVMNLFVELNRKGITVILVTHEEAVASYAQRVLHLRDGILQNGG